METSELRQHLYDLSPIEIERLKTGEEVPSPFYAQLDQSGQGLLPDGTYLVGTHLNKLATFVNRDDPTIYGRLYTSPLQLEGMYIKRASRFYQEPIASCNSIAIRYVYSGISSMIVERGQLTLREGDLCLLSSGLAVSQRLDRIEDLVFTLIFSREQLIRHIVERVQVSNVVTRFCMSHIMEARQPHNYILFHGAQNERIRPVFERLLCEYIDVDEFSRGMVDALVPQLVYEMLRCPYDFDETPVGRRDAALAQMLDYVDGHFATVTLHELSERFGYTEKYVSRLFGRATGGTFKAYVNERRMRHAASLLSNTDLTVHEVAVGCGLENMTHFYRLFSTRFGCTPKEYRARARDAVGNEQWVRE